MSELIKLFSGVIYDLDARSVFAIKLDVHHRDMPLAMARLEADWASAWPDRTPPKLLIFDRGSDLLAIGEALRQVGTTAE